MCATSLKVITQSTPLNHTFDTVPTERLFVKLGKWNKTAHLAKQILSLA